MTSQFNKKFAAMFRSGVKPTAVAAAFGKLPGYGDHFEFPTPLPPVVAGIRQVMYVGGIKSWVGPWNRLAAEGKVIPFGHTIIHENGSDVTLLRVTPSEDAVSRAGFPLIVCASISGLPASAALAIGGPLLAQTDAVRESLRTEAQLQGLVERLQKDLLAGMEAAAAGDSSDAGAVARLVVDPKMGLEAGLLLTVLGSLEDKLKLGDGRRRPALPGERAVHLRVPATEAVARRSGLSWAEFLNVVLDFKAAAFYAIAPDGNQWVDLLVGEPTEKQFGCLRAGLEEFPFTAVSAAALRGAFADKARRFLRDQNPAIAVPIPVEKPKAAEVGQRLEAVPVVSATVPVATAIPVAAVSVAVPALAKEAVIAPVSPVVAVPKVETKPVVVPPVAAVPKVETKPVVVPPVAAVPKVEAKPVVVPPVVAMPKVEAKPVVVPPVAAVPKVETKPVAVPLAVATPKVEAKPVVVPPVVAVPKVEATPVMVPPVAAVPKVETKPVVVSPVVATPKVEMKPVAVPLAVATPKVETKPVVAPPVVAVPKVETKPVVAPPVVATPKVETKPVVAPPVVAVPKAAVKPAVVSAKVAARPVETKSAVVRPVSAGQVEAARTVVAAQPVAERVEKPADTTAQTAAAVSSAGEAVAQPGLSAIAAKKSRRPAPWRNLRVMFALVAVVVVGVSVALLMRPAPPIVSGGGSILPATSPNPVPLPVVVADPRSGWDEKADRQAATLFHQRLDAAHKVADGLAERFAPCKDLVAAMSAALSAADKHAKDVDDTLNNFWSEPARRYDKTQLEQLHAGLDQLNKDSQADLLSHLTQNVVAAASQSLAGRPLGWSDAAQEWKDKVAATNDIGGFTALASFWDNISRLDTQRTATVAKVAFQDKTALIAALMVSWQHQVDKSFRPLLVLCAKDKDSLAGELASAVAAVEKTAGRFNGLPGDLANARKLLASPADGNVETVEELAARIKSAVDSIALDANDSVMQDIAATQQSLKELAAKELAVAVTKQKQAEALAAIAKESDPDKLAAQCVDGADDAMTMAIWHQWPKSHLPALTASIENDADVRACKFFRSKPSLPESEIEKVAGDRWNQRLEAIARPTDDDLEEMITLRDDLGLGESVKVSVRWQYNFALQSLKKALGSESIGQEQVVGLLAKFQTDFGSNAALAKTVKVQSLRDALKKKQFPDSFTVKSLKPESNLSLKLIRVQDDSGKPPFYIATAEFPVGMFCEIRGVLKAQNRDIIDLPTDKTDMRLRVGPYSWVVLKNGEGAMTWNKSWLEGMQEYQNCYKQDSDAVFFQPPVASQSPMQFVTVGMAIAVAKKLECRLPTPAEWDRALKEYPPTPRGSEDPLVVAFIKKLAEDNYVDATHAGPFQDAFRYHGFEKVKNWFKDEDLDAPTPEDLGGNVAEWAYDGVIAAATPIDPGQVMIMGDSVFSKGREGGFPLTELKKQKELSAAFSDVGFRLACDPWRAVSVENIRDSVEKATYLATDDVGH